MPSLFAITFAVISWSPVIITGVIPASLHFLTAFSASFLGGSSIPISPINERSLSTFSLSELISLNATPITLKPPSAISLFAFSMARTSYFVRANFPFFENPEVQSFKRYCGAPFVITT